VAGRLVQGVAIKSANVSHLRERIAELPDAAEPRAGADDRPAHVSASRTVHGGGEPDRQLRQWHDDACTGECRM